MRVVGVRELKASLSETLREVSRGGRVRVTSRGRAVADIVPAAASADDHRIRELVAAGRLVPPGRALPDRPPPLLRTSRAASELVLDERDAGR